MKQIIIFVILSTLTFSCKNEVKPIVKPSGMQLKISTSTKEVKKTEALTRQQLNDFFPDYIGANKRFNVFIVSKESMGTASYGSFDSSYNYSINDCVKDDSVIKNFEVSYNASYNAPEGTEYIIKERDGFKTIAFLQPKINRYDIQFVYKNRFKLVLEGSEHPDILWSYIKKEDLEKLNNY